MTEWMDQALCKGRHHDLWFPPLFVEDRTAPESHYDDIAKMICEQCPVREECEELGKDEEMGTWGGWSRKDRINGQRTFSRRVLPRQYINRIPKHQVDIPLNIPALKASLKGYTEARNKR